MHVAVCQHRVWLHPEHTHLVCFTLYHATTVLNIVPCNNTMKKHIVQRHNAGIVPRWKKRTQYTAHSARRHRPKAQICRNYPRGGPRGPTKNCPQKTGGKKGIGGGALIWRFEWGGIFQQKYDRWGLCEACVAQAKVPGPKWLMVNTDWHTTVSFQMYTFLSLLM